MHMAGKTKKRTKKATNKKEENKGEKICFVIAPIGKPDSDIRRRSDQVLKHIIEKAVEPLGYKPIRADQISEPGIITSQVIQHVVDSPLVVADLTGRNPNVFYELAIRHAIKKPLVQIINMEEQIPFDVAGTRTISVNIHDLDNVEEAKNELVKQIKSIEKGKAEMDTPISVALDLKILKESENPEERSFAEVVGAISELRALILSIEKRMGNPEVLLPPDYLDNLLRRSYRMMGLLEPRRQRMILERARALASKKKISAEDKAELKRLLGFLTRRLDSARAYYL